MGDESARVSMFLYAILLLVLVVLQQMAVFIYRTNLSIEAALFMSVDFV